MMSAVAALFAVACDEEYVTYYDAEYVMFADQQSTNMVLADQEYFSVPVASTVACNYDRTFGVEVIDKIADATNHAELKQLSAKDLNINFTIRDGRIATQPFDLKMGNMALTLSGTTGLDQTIDYTGKLKLPSSTSGINTIDLKIGGKFKSPSISIDTKSMAKQAANAATEKAVEAAAEKLGIDLKNAEKQKEELVQAAQDAANKLVEEAEKQKSNLVSKAGNNAIKKLAAEKAGDALITEAKKKGEQLVAEAEKKGNSLIQKAQQ